MTEQREQVEQWIEAMGCDPQPTPDSDVRWHLTFEYPLGSNHEMHVVGPPDKPNAVYIATGTPVAPKHVKAFEQLSDGEKRDFQIELRRAMNCVEADFQIQGVDSMGDCPEQFQTSVTRYEDGLSLDSFARSVGAVFKTNFEGVLVVQKRLEGRGLSGESRFDFERLDV